MDGQQQPVMTGYLVDAPLSVTGKNVGPLVASNACEVHDDSAVAGMTAAADCAGLGQAT